MSADYIPQDHVVSHCKPAKREITCRYLSMSHQGWQCVKLAPMGRQIDGGIYRLVAQGDNCEGLEMAKPKGKPNVP